MMPRCDPHQRTFELNIFGVESHRRLDILCVQRGVPVPIDPFDGTDGRGIDVGGCAYLVCLHCRLLVVWVRNVPHAVRSLWQE